MLHLQHLQAYLQLTNSALVKAAGAETKADRRLLQQTLQLMVIMRLKRRSLSSAAAGRRRQQKLYQKQLKGGYICYSGESISRSTKVSEDNAATSLRRQRQNLLNLPAHLRRPAKSISRSRRKQAKIMRRHLQQNLKQKQLKCGICDSGESLSRCGQSK